MNIVRRRRELAAQARREEENIAIGGEDKEQGQSAEDT
jgi:hypothetical protein